MAGAAVATARSSIRAASTAFMAGCVAVRAARQGPVVSGGAHEWCGVCAGEASVLVGWAMCGSEGLEWCLLGGWERYRVVQRSRPGAVYCAAK